MATPTPALVGEIELPDGHWWTWSDGRWEPLGWDPEAEVAMARLSGRSGFKYQAARVAPSGCPRDAHAAAAAWAWWMTGRALPMPERPLRTEQFDLVTSDPKTLLRAVKARHCPLDLLAAGLRSSDPAVRSAAVCHPLLPYPLRCAHAEGADEAHMRAMAASPTTPLERLRSLAGPGHPIQVRVAAITNDQFPEAEAANALALIPAEQILDAGLTSPRAALLRPLVLRHAIHPVLLATFIALDGEIVEEELWRLLGLGLPQVDAALAGTPAISADQAAADTLTERALAYLEGGGTGPNPLLRAVLAYRLWRTPEQEDALLSANRHDPETRNDAVMGWWRSHSMGWWFPWDRVAHDPTSTG